MGTKVLTYQFYYIWLDVINIPFLSRSASSSWFRLDLVELPPRAIWEPDEDWLDGGGSKTQRSIRFDLMKLIRGYKAKGTWWKSRINEEFPSRSFATVISNTFPRLFNLFIYESISNSFDYILFAPGVSIFAIKNGNTLHFTRSGFSPGYFLVILNGVLYYSGRIIPSEPGTTTNAANHLPPVLRISFL